MCLLCIQFLHHFLFSLEYNGAKPFNFLRQLKGLSCCEVINCTFLIIYCIFLLLIIMVNYKHCWLMYNLNEDTLFRSSQWIRETMKLLIVMGEGFTTFSTISFWRPKGSLHLFSFSPSYKLDLNSLRVKYT